MDSAWNKVFLDGDKVGRDTDIEEAIDELEDLKMDTEEHKLSYDWLQSGKTVDMRSVTSTCSVSIKESCNSKDSHQKAVRLDGFLNVMNCVAEYKENNTTEIIKYDSDIKEEETDNHEDIRTITEKHRFNYKLLQIEDMKNEFGMDSIKIEESCEHEHSQQATAKLNDFVDGMNYSDEQREHLEVHADVICDSDAIKVETNIPEYVKIDMEEHKLSYACLEIIEPEEESENMFTSDNFSSKANWDGEGNRNETRNSIDCADECRKCDAIERVIMICGNDSEGDNVNAGVYADVYTHNGSLNSKDPDSSSGRKVISVTGKQNIDPSAVKMDIEYELGHKCLEIDKTEDVREEGIVDDTSDLVGFTSQHDEQMTVKLNDAWDELSCDNRQGEYNGPEFIKYESDVKEEEIDSEDVLIDNEKCAQDETMNSENLKSTYVACENNSESSRNIRGYPCKFCGYKAENLLSLKTHLENHKEMQWYYCHHCEFKSVSKINLKKHFTQKHDDRVEWYNCEHCVFKTKRKSDLKKHFERKHSTKWHKCQHCEFKTKDETYLMRHFKVKHDANAKWYKCSICDYKSKIYGNFRQHSKSHHCKHCTFKMKHRDSLQEHLESKDGIVSEKGKLLCCQFCDCRSKFKRLHLITKHSKNKEWHHCQFCDFKTKLIASLRRHFDTKHDQDSEWHQCQLCAFKTKHKASLLIHLEFKHSIVSEKGKLHYCQFCDYKSKFKKILKLHLKTKHDQNTGWHHCQFCDYRSEFKKVLKLHLKTEHSEKMEWYHCKQCEFRTVDKSSLINHFRFKHDVNAKWYKCSICDYKTKQSCSLKRHFNTQHDQDIEWHNCQHCAFKTKHKGSLKGHLEYKHNIVGKKGELHHCQFCDYTAKLKKILRLHLKTEHSEKMEWHHCQQCEFKTRDKSSLINHFKFKHDPNAEWYQCCFCDYKTKQNINFKQHYKTQHAQDIEWHNCRHCAFKTKYKVSLEAHLEFKHNIVTENGKLRYCQFCDYRSKFKRFLELHLETEHDLNTEWHRCQTCEFKTQDKGSLEKHLEYGHNIVTKKGKLHQCQFCDYRSKFKKILKLHLKTKHFRWKHDNSARRYECQHCEFKTKDKSSLIRHFKVKHDANAKWYKCSICDYKTKHNCSLKRHFNTQHDQDIEWHYCQHCAFKTKHKLSLEKHLEYKHSIVSENGKLHYCQFCDYRSKFKKILKLHLKNNHDQNMESYHCQTSELNTQDESSLISDFKVKHDAKGEANVDDTSDLVGFNIQHDEQMTVKLNGAWDGLSYDNGQAEYFVTEFIKCDSDVEKEKINPEDVLIDNEQCAQNGTMSSENLGSTNVVCEHNYSKSSSNIQWYCCEFCQYKTKFVDSFRKHLEDKHKEGHQWYYCHLCEFRTASKTYLKKHFRLRHDDSAECYKCQQCEFKTKDKNSLRIHLKLKHDANAKWYKCDFCDYKSKQNGSLKRHFKTQHDQDSEWHNCQHCDFKTKHKGSLRGHLEYIHSIVSEKGKLHYCQFCDYRSKVKKILKLHLKNKHDQNMEWYPCPTYDCEFKTEDESSLMSHFKVKHDAKTGEVKEEAYVDDTSDLVGFNIQHDEQMTVKLNGAWDELSYDNGEAEYFVTEFIKCDSDVEKEKINPEDVLIDNEECAQDETISSENLGSTNVVCEHNYSRSTNVASEHNYSKF